MNPRVQYQGDEHFEALLGALRCPSSLPEIKMYVFGSIAATEMVAFTRLLPILWQGKEPVYRDEEQAKDFIGNLTGLWYLLAQHQDGTPFRLTPFSKTSGVRGIKERISVRRVDLKAFIRGLDLGGTDTEKMQPNGQEAVHHIAQADAILEQYQHVLEKAGDSHLEETSRLMDELDGVFEKHLGLVMRAQTEYRRRAVQERRAIALPARDPLPTVGRNDPCPCGSGKKYKRCCGING